MAVGWGSANPVTGASNPEWGYDSLASTGGGFFANPLNLALIGAGLGLLRGSAKQREAYEQQRKNAELMRWSFLTDYKPQMISTPSVIDPMLQGAFGGLSTWQALSEAGAFNR